MAGRARVIHWVNAFSVLALVPLGVFILASELLEFPEEGVDSIIGAHAATGFILAAGAAARIILPLYRPAGRGLEGPPDPRFAPPRSSNPRPPPLDSPSLPQACSACYGAW